MDFEVSLEEDGIYISLFEDNGLIGRLGPYRKSIKISGKTIAEDILGLGLDKGFVVEDADGLAAKIIDDIVRGEFTNLNNIDGNVDNVVYGIGHIAMIERPDYAGKHVKVNVTVSSTSMAYLAPSLIYVRYLDKDEEGEYEDILYVSRDDVANAKFIAVPEGVYRKRIYMYLRDRLSSGKILEYKVLKYRTIYKLRVRHPVLTLEKNREGKIVDEKGFEYKSFDIYIVSDRELDLTPSSLLILIGVVIPDPKTQKVTILAYNVEEYEDISRFDKDKLDVLRELFKTMSIGERVKWVKNNLKLYSHIINRDNLFLAELLTYLTPLRIKLDHEVENGWGITAIVGDTTTAKSKTVKKLIELFGLGMYTTAETISIVGLTGTAMQIEKSGWFVDWGFLPLNDRKLLVIDGAQKLSSGAHAKIAEAEREGVVIVGKAAKNRAYARTREIKIANAVDPQAGKFKTKKIRHFLYPAQALPTVYDAISIARFDLAVFTREGDVKAEEVNIRFTEEYDPRLKNLSEVVKWCWNNTAEIVFEDEAVDYLLAEATRLHNKFHYGDIPIVSINMKWKLAKLSVALAYLTLSTEDYSQVIVTKEHVQYIVRFLENEYTQAGLHILAETTKHEVLDKEEASNILKRISLETKIDDEKIRSILRFIVLKGRVTRDQIKQKFGLSERNELRALTAVLSTLDLVKTGKGIYPQPKLIELYKIHSNQTVDNEVENE